MVSPFSPVAIGFLVSGTAAGFFSAESGVFASGTSVVGFFSVEVGSFPAETGFSFFSVSAFLGSDTSASFSTGLFSPAVASFSPGFCVEGCSCSLPIGETPSFS